MLLVLVEEILSLADIPHFIITVHGMLVILSSKCDEILRKTDRKYYVNYEVIGELLTTATLYMLAFLVEVIV